LTSTAIAQFEYFDRTLADSEEALRQTLQISPRTKIEVVQGLTTQLFYQAGKWLFDEKKFLTTYANNENDGASQLARYLLLAQIFQFGINYVGYENRNLVLNSAYSQGVVVAASMLAGNYVHDQLQYSEFPVSDEKVIEKMVKEKADIKVAMTTYELTNEFYEKLNRQGPAAIAVLLHFCNPRQRQVARSLERMEPPEMVMTSGLREDLGHIVPKESLISMKYKVQKLHDGIIVDIEKRDRQWDLMESKFRAMAEILSDFDGAALYVSGIFDLIERARDEIRYHTAKKTYEYPVIAIKTLKKIDAKFLPNHEEKEPETDEEKISTVIFPKGNIIRF